MADLREISSEELEEILNAHRTWVESEGKKRVKADLFGANLREASLVQATGLTVPQVKAANNWEMAFYGDDLLQKLGLPSDHNERVKKKLPVTKN